MRALLLCLLVLGCDDVERVDPCLLVADGDSCLQLHLLAEPALADAQITSVLLWVHYFPSGVERYQRVETPMRAPTKFPVAVGLRVQSGTSAAADLHVEALNGPGIVAYNKASFAFGGNKRVSVDVTMQRATISGCFDGQHQAVTESDVDCGGGCPPCAGGRNCIDGSDCQSAQCLNLSCN
jgi:hypothetical protein